MSNVTIRCPHCEQLERENAAIKAMNKELCDSINRLENEVEGLKLDEFLGEFKRYYNSLREVEPTEKGWAKRMLARIVGG